eukprot:6213258-Pleurochrysis_carterae.AAC.2
MRWPPAASRRRHSQLAGDQRGRVSNDGLARVVLEGRGRARLDHGLERGIKPRFALCTCPGGHALNPSQTTIAVGTV